jgi:excisionase family DNA binding protein
MHEHERRALYVRLPHTAAEKLDQAAFEMRVSKQDLVADLLNSHLPMGSTRRLIVDLPDDTMTVGHHSFVPTEAPQVLTLAEAADLLRSDEKVVRRMAEDGTLPARKVGDDWRFTREAVLRWLGGDENEEG